MFIRSLLVLFFMFLIVSPPVLADNNAEADKAALAVFMQSDVVKKFYREAYGYAIFPTIGKGGFGIGAAHGAGRVYRGGQKTGTVSVTQVSIGFQAGGQAYRQLVFFEDKRAFDDFTRGEFSFAAQAEAIAITSSVGAQAGTEGTSASANSSQSAGRYNRGMIVFTIGIGGFMYQATLGGQKYIYRPLK